MIEIQYPVKRFPVHVTEIEKYDSLIINAVNDYEQSRICSLEFELPKELNYECKLVSYDETNERIIAYIYYNTVANKLDFAGSYIGAIDMILDDLGCFDYITPEKKISVVKKDGKTSKVCTKVYFDSKQNKFIVKHFEKCSEYYRYFFDFLVRELNKIPRQEVQ